MKFWVGRFVSPTATLLIYTVIAFATLSPGTLAQEAPVFEITVVPQAQYAVAGHHFTYTVVITNVSQQPWKDVVVKVKTPTGSTFVNSYFANPAWLVGGVQRGQAGDVIWLTQLPVAPAESVTFDLVVDIPPQPATQELVSREYAVTTLTDNRLLGSGPPVRIRVMAPTPAPSPLPVLTGTPVPPAAASPTPASSPPSEPAAAAVTGPAQSTPTSQTRSAAGKATPLLESVVENAASTESSLFISRPILIGLGLLIIVIIGAAWFFGHRQP